ncbi:MAG: hypothetical protein ACTSYS_13810 [Promethearchaeota archaeon]
MFSNKEKEDYTRLRLKSVALKSLLINIIFLESFYFLIRYIYKYHHLQDKINSTYADQWNLVFYYLLPGIIIVFSILSSLGYYSSEYAGKLVMYVFQGIIIGIYSSFTGLKAQIDTYELICVGFFLLTLMLVYNEINKDNGELFILFFASLILSGLSFSYIFGTNNYLSTFCLMVGFLGIFLLAWSLIGFIIVLVLYGFLIFNLFTFDFFSPNFILVYLVIPFLFIELINNNFWTREAIYYFLSDLINIAERKKISSLSLIKDLEAHKVILRYWKIKNNIKQKNFNEKKDKRVKLINHFLKKSKEVNKLPPNRIYFNRDILTIFKSY